MHRFTLATTSLNSTKQVINTLLIKLIAIVSKTESTASHRIPRHCLLFRTAKMNHAALNMHKATLLALSLTYQRFGIITRLLQCSNTQATDPVTSWRVFESTKLLISKETVGLRQRVNETLSYLSI